MNAGETLELIRKKYNLDYTKESPFKINCGRLDCLLELFKELGFQKGAEVGVYDGYYSDIILTKVPSMINLIGVDAWEEYKEYRESMGGTVSDIYSTAKKVYAKHNKRATIIKGYSTEVAKTIPDGSLDFVFIDANHAYEFVVADIAAWSPKVRRGGIIYGHDFDDFSQVRRKWRWMNVVNAVTGWVKSNKIHPWFVIYGGDRGRSCWLYVKG
jgi:predicted O-methyltransferase YrrM